MAGEQFLLGGGIIAEMNGQSPNAPKRFGDLVGSLHICGNAWSRRLLWDIPGEMLIDSLNGQRLFPVLFNPGIKATAFNSYFAVLEQLIKNFMNLVFIKTGHLFQGSGVNTILGILDDIQNTKSSRHVPARFLGRRLNCKIFYNDLLDL